MVNEEKDCEPADFEHFKNSDSRKLGADAKMLIALIKKQPLKRLELCKAASINEATFSRHKRLLKNRGIIRETANGYVLWNYVDRTGLWERLQDDLGKAGGDMIMLRFERLSLTKDRDPITGWFGKKYDEYLIRGIMILEGAIELSAIAKVSFSDECHAVLLTEALTDEGDRIRWRGKCYEVKKVKEIFDGYNLSYRIVSLIIRI